MPEIITYRGILHDWLNWSLFLGASWLEYRNESWTHTRKHDWWRQLLHVYQLVVIIAGGGREGWVYDRSQVACQNVSITMKYRIEFSKLTCDYWILLFTRPRMVYNCTLRLEVCASCHIKRFLMSKNCQRDCLYSLDKRIIIRFHLVDICVSSIHKIRVHEYINSDLWIPDQNLYYL